MLAQFFTLALLASNAQALIRFGCSQLVVERLDPLVDPGKNPSPHVHQIIGGVCIHRFTWIFLEAFSLQWNVIGITLCWFILFQNSFKPDMRHPNHDLVAQSTCTTCQPSDDFSNYWTAALYFRARNGTYKRVPQKGNVGSEGQRGGMTVYYMQNHLADYQQRSKVTAFQKVMPILNSIKALLSD